MNKNKYSIANGNIKRGKMTPSNNKQQKRNTIIGKTNSHSKKLSTPKAETFWLILVVGLTAIFYIPALRNGFVDWDDNVYIQNNPYIFSLNLENIHLIFSEYFMGNYHPLTMLSYAIEYSFAGYSPFIYHLTNLVIHLVNTTLVFLFVRNLLTKINSDSAKKYSLTIPTIVALLFGLHPMHVESVGWVSERKDVLYGFFFLLALLSYLRFLSTKKITDYLVCILFFVLSLLSKGMAVSLAVSVVAIDFLLKRNLRSGKVLLEKIPFFALALVFGVIAVLAQKSDDAIVINLGLADKISFASNALVQYVAKLIIPVNLSHFYPYPDKIAGNFPIYYYIYSIVLVAGATVVFYFIRKSRILIFGLLFFLANIVLVLRIIPLGDTIMADRYTYISSIGIFIILAYLIDCGIERWSSYKKYIITATALYLGCMGFLTFGRTQVWKNSFSLWNDAAKKYPDNSVIATNLGLACEKDGNIKEALSLYNKSIQLNPNNDSPYANLGNLKLEAEDRVGALTAYNKAIALNSRNTKALNNRGKILIDLGKFAEAISDFNRAIEIDPIYTSAYHNRGVAKFKLAQYDQAIADFRQATRLNPKFGMGYFMLGLSHVSKGENTVGCENFRKAYNLNLKEAKNYIDKYCN